MIYTGPGHEHFRTLQLFGFIVLIFGTLVYNEILVIPFLGLNYYTKVNIARRENGDNADEFDYVGVSPIATYDGKREARNSQKKMDDAKNNKTGGQNDTDIY